MLGTRQESGMQRRGPGWSCTKGAVSVKDGDRSPGRGQKGRIEGRGWVEGASEGQRLQGSHGQRKCPNLTARLTITRPSKPPTTTHLQLQKQPTGSGGPDETHGDGLDKTGTSMQCACCGPSIMPPRACPQRGRIAQTATLKR